MPVRFNPFTGNLDLVDTTAAAGSDTQVQFNDGGSLGGDSGLTFNKTTDALSAGGFVPTSSTVPTNGVYLPATNTVGLATNSTQRISVDANGNVAVDTNTLYVDAVNNRVSIGTTSPTLGLLDVRSALTATPYGVDVARFNNIDPANSSGQTTFISIGTAYADDHEGVVRIGAERSGTSNKASIVFHTSDSSSASSEKARLTSDGKWLVGTSSDSQNTTLLIQGSSAGSGSSFLRLCNTSSAPGDGSNLSVIAFCDSGHTNAATIHSARDGGTWTSGSSQPTRLVFSTTADGASSPTERMRITSSGAILLGCTSAPNPGAASTVNGWAVNGTNTDAYVTAKGDGAPVGYFRRDGTDGDVFGFRKGSAAVGSISVTASATAYNTSSDYRLKENIIPLTGAIDRINQLQVHRFNFIADPGKTVDGFIAHEAQAVVPECVTGEKDAIDDDGNPVYQGIDQSKLVPLLTAALQEAIAKIETLEAKVAALEAS